MNRKGWLHFFYFLFFIQVRTIEVFLSQFYIKCWIQVFICGFFQWIYFVKKFQKGMITKKVKKFHIVDLFRSWFRLNFYFTNCEMIGLFPVLLKLVFINQFVVFNTNFRPIDWCIPLFLDFLIDFTHIPFKSFVVKICNVFRYQLPKYGWDLTFFLLRVRKEL